MNKQGPNGIPYCDYTWSPVTGCYHGCNYCFARTIANRFTPKDYNGIMSTVTYDEKLGVNICEHDERSETVGITRLPFPYGFMPTLYYSRLNEPKHPKKPARIFVSDMGDLFGDWVPVEWIEAVLKTVRECPQHTFLFLTKNPKRYQEFEWTDNAWLGTTVENQSVAFKRIIELLQAKAKLFWVSVEPMMGPVDLINLKDDDGDILDALGGGYYSTDGSESYLSYNSLGWVVAGGMTGRDAKPVHPDWIRGLRDQCQAAGVPFFFKQWGEWGADGPVTKERYLARPGGHLLGEGALRDRGDVALYHVDKKKAGRLLDGRTWEDLPGTTSE